MANYRQCMENHGISMDFSDCLWQTVVNVWKIMGFMSDCVQSNHIKDSSFLIWNHVILCYIHVLSMFPRKTDQFWDWVKHDIRGPTREAAALG